MKTMKEVRRKLVDLNGKLEDGTLDFKTVSEMHNGIGKIINTIRTQLEYSKLRKEQPQIDFMKCH